jgi:UbiD family decarboxylase
VVEHCDHGALAFPTPICRASCPRASRPANCGGSAYQVDPTLEISEIVTRTVRAGGPALLFERPTRGDMPVAINLFGTEKRMAMALGVRSLDEVGDRIGALIKPELPVGLSGIREGLGKVLQLKSVPPKKLKTGPCQEIVLEGERVDLNRLPGLQVWPGDGGIFHNYGLTHTKHPETGKRNLGLYRLQQHSHNTLGMHWQIHKDSTAHHAVAERLGQRLPVAIAIGCDPIVSYAASAPLPGDIDEYLFAASCAANAWRWWTAARCRCRSPRRHRSCWRDTSNPVNARRRARSATTPASTRRSSRSRCCTSRR